MYKSIRDITPKKDNDKQQQRVNNHVFTRSKTVEPMDLFDERNLMDNSNKDKRLSVFSKAYPINTKHKPMETQLEKNSKQKLNPTNLIFESNGGAMGSNQQKVTVGGTSSYNIDNIDKIIGINNKNYTNPNQQEYITPKNIKNTSVSMQNKFDSNNSKTNSNRNMLNFDEEMIPHQPEIDQNFRRSSKFGTKKVSNKNDKTKNYKYSVNPSRRKSNFLLL